MKKIIIFILFSVFMYDCFAIPVVVRHIIDGDTFIGDVLLDNNIEISSVSIRLRNVDTPELHGECDKEIKQAEYAKQRLSELIPVDSIIQIDSIKNDKYVGRIDANVYNSVNQDVGLILIRENIGRAYSGGKRQTWCNKD